MVAVDLLVVPDPDVADDRSRATPRALNETRQPKMLGVDPRLARSTVAGLGADDIDRPPLPFVRAYYLGVHTQRVETSQHVRGRPCVSVHRQQQQRIYRRTEVDPDPVVERSDALTNLDQTAFLGDREKRYSQLAWGLHVHEPLRFLLFAGGGVGGVVLQKSHCLEVLTIVAVAHG